MCMELYMVKCSPCFTKRVFLLMLGSEIKKIILILCQQLRCILLG